MKTQELSDFPDELLKVKEIVKKQRWIESRGSCCVRKITFTGAERANLL
jgi:hypothetical protein